MNITALLLAQVGPTYAFPQAIFVKAKQNFAGQQVRTYTSEADDLELVQTDRLSATITSTEPAVGKSTWAWKVQSVSQKLDGQLLHSDPKDPPFSFTEVRSKIGAQYSFETGLDEGNGQMLVTRFNTIPLPSTVLGIGDTWEFRDARFMPYVFRGRILSFENGLYKIRASFQGLESPKFNANGTAWIGIDGLPTKIELTASPIEIPGSEGQKTTLTLQFSLNRK
ncbi:MAG: hypothetical protein JNK63_11650 [Chthonomonas sp.]|nr:hypothetical protein [Chthonomonas sp.]